MPTINSQIIINAPLPLVWEIAQQVEKFPDIMPDLDSVKILEEEQTTPVTRRVVTDWVGRIKQFNRKVAWTEEDVWNYETHTCHFWQLKGDFDEYKGEWKFERDGANTRATIELDYRFDVPLIGALMGKVVQKLMQDNSDSMLKSLKAEAERQVGR
jgi:ribosome-associated toxin RatA of RatAB toxin-antitoxin module